MLPREADAAEDLDRGVADRGQPTRECLGAQRRAMPFVGVGRVGRPQRVDHAAAREFDRLVHVDAQALDRLEAADRLVELPAHLRVVHGEVHHRLRGAERVGGVRDQHVVDQRVDRVFRRVRKQLRGCVVQPDVEQLASSDPRGHAA